MQDSPTIIEVAIPLRLDTTFHYLVPLNLASAIQIGKRVLAPFGRRKVTGYIIGRPRSVDRDLLEIIEVLDREPLFTPKELEFLRWTAAYYLHPLGEVLKGALPAGINVEIRRKSHRTADGSSVTDEVLSGGRRAKTSLFYRAMEVSGSMPPLKGKSARVHEYLRKVGETRSDRLRIEAGADSALLKRLREGGYIYCEEREVYRDPFREEVFGRDCPLILNSAQREALERITAAADGGGFAPFLLHGVTGSGKTEVYLQAISHLITLGKRALVLVPEISLTPQLVKRFKRRFDCGIAVLHSGLSEGERFDEWRRIRRGEAVIVIGARSAIFAPLERIGIIVVDEEHDASYKQSEGLRYNARDMAMVRGKMERACVVLGSATPLVTTYHAAREGRITCLNLPDRVRELPMPEIELVDGRGRKGETFLPELTAAIGKNLLEGGQTLLFINRRGFATFLICGECGHVMDCPNCSVTLTYHRRKGRHFCHYCDFSVPAPSICPACHSPEISLLGRGTERVEEEARLLFPSARIGRMDRDTTRGRGGHARVLRGLEEGTIDILIGTQMIAKGHDFPGVTLVGVVSADASLNIPDFRSAERTFQLITQVMGRAGRGDSPGRVVVQSLAPDHYAITRATTHDFEGFYADELKFRREALYPPYAHLAALLFSGNSAAEVEKGADLSARLLREVKLELKSRVEILGPASPPLAKVRGRYRRLILLKSVNRPDLHRLLNSFRGKLKLPSVVRLSIDIDPLDMV